MSTPASTSGPLGQPRGIGFRILIFIIVWFVRVQGALNRYWESKAAAAPAAAASVTPAT